MFRGLQSILMISFILSVSLFGGKNVALTKEIENRRECVVYAIRNDVADDSEESAEAVIGYTEGFWMEDDETTYLLKTYGKAVLEVKKNTWKEIPLSATALPVDVISDKENLYIYDEILDELQIYTKQGELLVCQKVELENDYVKNLVKTEHGIAVCTHGGKKIPLDCQTAELKLSETTELPKVEAAEGYNCAEYIGTDEDGTIYSVHTKLVSKRSVLAGELTLRAVTADGELKGIYILPTQEYRYLPGKYIHVMDNGNIYLLAPVEGGVEVRKIALKEEMESNFSAISKKAKEIEIDYKADVRYRKNEGTACTEKIKVSREEARERADAMAEYVWTLKRTHTLTSKGDKGIMLPREIAYYQEKNADKSSWSVEIKGIPYCWGGFYALDVGVGKQTFPQMIKNKYVAGNIQPTGYYKYMTTGLDCSGYVCAVFKFKSKTNTGGLSCLGSAITDVKKLQPMDILVWPGEHVIFFMEWVDDATMLISEANVRNGKVVTHPKTINELIVGEEYQMRSPW